MAKLTNRERHKLSASQFALPEERKYPVNDESHAANAKARATQQYERGNLSAEERSKINRKANRILHKLKDVTD